MMSVASGLALSVNNPLEFVDVAVPLPLMEIVTSGTAEPFASEIFPATWICCACTTCKDPQANVHNEVSKILFIRVLVSYAFNRFWFRSSIVTFKGQDKYKIKIFVKHKILYHVIFYRGTTPIPGRSGNIHCPSMTFIPS